MGSKYPTSQSYPINNIPSYDNPMTSSSPYGNAAPSAQRFHMSSARDSDDDLVLPPRKERRSFTLPAALDPRQWGKWTRIIVWTVVAVVAVIVVVVGVVLGIRNNRYPDYTPLKYSLKSTFNPNTFYDNFEFWTEKDPAHGFVQYDSAQEASNLNLTHSTPQSALLRVDDSLHNHTKGRHSVRVESTQTYNSGLFLFDIHHSPIGCGTWPAVWLSDTSHWPSHGEIDIVEAVNGGVLGNTATLHTGAGCTMSVKRKQTGEALQKDCHNATHANAGCGVRAQRPATFGPDFNDNGGGVFATEWRKAGIRMWFFARDTLPPDVRDAVSVNEKIVGGPDPSTWGPAMADFPSIECDITSHFKNASIVANIDLCGPWAGSTKTYGGQSKCPGDCKDYVANTPGAFAEAYWEFGAFRVYSAAGEA